MNGELDRLEKEKGMTVGQKLLVNFVILYLMRKM